MMDGARAAQGAYSTKSLGRRMDPARRLRSYPTMEWSHIAPGRRKRPHPSSTPPPSLHVFQFSAFFISTNGYVRRMAPGRRTLPHPSSPQPPSLQGFQFSAFFISMGIEINRCTNTFEYLVREL